MTIKTRLVRLEKSAEPEYLMNLPQKLYSKRLVVCQPEESSEEAAKRLGLEPGTRSILVVGVKAD